MDDNTPYITGDSIDDVTNSLENDLIQLFKRFADYQMKANKEKCHLLVGSSEYVTIKCRRQYNEKKELCKTPQ